MKFTWVLLQLLLCTYWASGQSYQATAVGHETTVPVPDAVVRTLKQLTPFTTDSLKWQCGVYNDSTYFRADFYQHQLAGSATFDPLGKTLEHEVEVPLNTLPLASRKAIYHYLLKNRKWWILHPLGIIRAQIDSNNGYQRWVISAFPSSIEEVKSDGNAIFFYVWEDGKITFPFFR